MAESRRGVERRDRVRGGADRRPRVGWDDAGTEAEIGYTLRLDHQGKGLATEAVAAVVERLFFEGVDRITSSLDPENVASIRVLEKVGFHYEASSRIQIRGAWVEDQLHVIVRGDPSARLVRHTEQPDRRSAPSTSVRG